MRFENETSPRVRFDAIYQLEDFTHAYRSGGKEGER